MPQLKLIITDDSAPDIERLAAQLRADGFEVVVEDERSRTDRLLEVFREVRGENESKSKKDLP